MFHRISALALACVLTSFSAATADSVADGFDTGTAGQAPAGWYVEKYPADAEGVGSD